MGRQTENKEDKKKKERKNKERPEDIQAHFAKYCPSLWDNVEESQRDG